MKAEEKTSLMPGLAIAIAFLVATFHLGASFGVAIQTHASRREAINNGAAFYSVDHKTGETSFVWKSAPSTGAQQQSKEKP